MIGKGPGGILAACIIRLAERSRSIEEWANGVFGEGNLDMIEVNTGDSGNNLTLPIYPCVFVTVPNN